MKCSHLVSLFESQFIILEFTVSFEHRDKNEHESTLTSPLMSFDHFRTHMRLIETGGGHIGRQLHSHFGVHNHTTSILPNLDSHSDTLCVRAPHN